MAKRWTEEEDALLLKLREEGYTTNEMVHYVEGRTAAAIRTRMRTIAPNNLNRLWTQEEKELVLKLKSEGKSNKYIARAVHRTHRAIEAFLVRYWNDASSKTTL